MKFASVLLALTALASLVLLASRGRNAPDSDKDTAPSRSDVSDTVAHVPDGPGTETELTEQQKDDIKRVVQGNNEFAFDLYSKLSETKGNVFFSPYSISSALGMTYAGARGNTAKEMAQTLHFTLDDEHLHSAFGGLIRDIQGRNRTQKRKYQLAVANSLWGAKHGLTLEPDFRRTTRDNYQAEFRALDFAGDAEGSRQTINGWVKENTNKRIENLLSKGLIQRTTRLVLVNAIYFKADWAAAFPKEATRPGNFTIPNAPSCTVPMMYNNVRAPYMATEDFQLAVLRYKDNEVSMVVVLPRKKDGLPEVEKKLSAHSLAEALARVHEASLGVTLPRFKMAETFSLGGELAQLGMREAFDQQKADFSGMSKAAGPRSGFAIAAILHKTCVEVEETGTEAAAATGVSVVRPVSKPGAPVPFRADHPFLFLLRHNATGSILFLGRVSDPRDP